jgi:uncharacterized protein (DUF2336 family)
VKDTEISVREALATALKHNPNVPRDIILSLTHDADTVALPILESSDVLNDDDLTALIQSAKHSQRPIAIAKRKYVSEVISAALVETHNATAIAALVKNSGAQISTETYQGILREHHKNSDIVTAMAKRPNLPVTVVEKIITLVSDSLADSLRTQYRLSPVTVAIETEKTREMATLKLVDGQVGHQDIEKLVEQLQAFGRLTPSIILTSLCQGNLYFFETSLARLSNIPVRNAQLLIHDKGGLGFKALYGRAGLPDKFMAACKLLLETVAEMQRGGQARDANVLVQKLIAKSTGKQVDNLSYIIALIRQNAQTA